MRARKKMDSNSDAARARGREEKEMDRSAGEMRGPNTMPVQEKTLEEEGARKGRRMAAKERSRTAGPELRNI